MSITMTTRPARPITPTYVDPERYRTTARESGPVPALVLLHGEVSAGVLPAGPGGHVLVPAEVEALCDRYEASAGQRSRGSGNERALGWIPTGGGALVALRITGAGPARFGFPPGGWSSGLAWVRLGLAERFLKRATAHLGGRTVQGTVTLNLPMVRAMVGEAAGALAEAHALIATAPEAPTAAAVRQVHSGLDEAGRICLRLFGAIGFLTDGPGGEVHASELLADTYAPPAPTVREWS
jgi:hypothetical protein